MKQEWGSPAPERREGRARLSVRDPQLEKLLSGLAIDDEELETARQFGKALWCARNSWSVAKAAERNSLGREVWGRK